MFSPDRPSPPTLARLTAKSTLNRLRLLPFIIRACFARDARLEPPSLATALAGADAAAGATDTEAAAGFGSAFGAG